MNSAAVGSPGARPLWLDSSALPQSGLLLQNTFGVLGISAPAREMQASVFSGKGKCALQGRERGADLGREESALAPGLSPNPGSLVGPENTVLIGLSGTVVIGWRGC